MSVACLFTIFMTLKTFFSNNISNTRSQSLFKPIIEANKGGTGSTKWFPKKNNLDPKNIYIGK